MSKYTPSGYSTASPYVIVRDASATIAFLKNIFDATLVRSFADESGRLMHAEVRIDDTIIMLADSAPNWRPVEGYVHVYVADVDETYRRALAAGAKSVQVPVQQGDEDKRGGIQDSGGTT